jgi:hypothetical protein
MADVLPRMIMMLRTLVALAQLLLQTALDITPVSGTRSISAANREQIC